MFGNKKRNNENRKFSVCQKSNGIFQHKKGISPLIATVLIVGFVIALSAIFWTFFSSTVKEQIDKQGADTEGKTKCMKVDISAVECKTDTTNVVTMKNNGKQSLAGIMFRFPMSGDTTVFTEQTELNAGDQDDYAPAGMTSAGEGEAIPLVAAKGFAYPCADKKVTFECKAA